MGYSQPAQICSQFWDVNPSISLPLPRFRHKYAIVGLDNSIFHLQAFLSLREIWNICLSIHLWTLASLSARPFVSDHVCISVILSHMRWLVERIAHNLSIIGIEEYFCYLMYMKTLTKSLAARPNFIVLRRLSTTKFSSYR